MQSITINLAGTDYEIKELTLGQIEEMQDAVLSPAPQGKGIDTKLNREIIAIAMSVDHPTITREVIRAMRLGSIQKVSSTVKEILKFGGFKAESVKQEVSKKPGEAPASAQ